MADTSSTTARVPVEDARARLGVYVRAAAATSGAVTVVSVNGIPAAAIVPPSAVPAEQAGDTS